MKTKTPGQFRFASLGDVHLGHPQTTTATIIQNLDRYCTNETVLKDLDLLIITGDLFDRLLQNAEEDAILSERWITRLLFKCAYLDVAVRVVEGTPSHDRYQSRFFVEQKLNANIPVDLHYATTLSIEHLERWGVTILYVPDKWRSDTQETLAEVKDLLRQHQLTQVDYAIMHGAFEYQLPSIVPEPTHSSDAYLDLVKHFILVGHVHFMSRNDRILAAGSYDRLNHGEEGAKGYYRVTQFASGESQVVFVENQGARRYDTLACHGLTTEAVNTLLRKHTKDLPPDSAVRIKCDPHDPVSGDLDAIRKQYPQFQWTLQVETAKKNQATAATLFQEFEIFDLEEIAPHNLLRLVESELERLAPDPAIRQRLVPRLHEVITS